MKRFAGQYAHG